MSGDMVRMFLPGNRKLPDYRLFIRAGQLSAAAVLPIGFIVC